MNPHARAHQRQARNRARSEGFGPPAARLLLALVGVGIAAALVRPVFLEFLDGPASGLAAGSAGIVLRLGLVIVGLASIDLYEGLIRGEDREVLCLLPVDPAQVVAAGVLQVARRRRGLVLAMAAVLLPIGLEGSWVAWALSVLALVGIQLFAWPAAAVVHLLAVHVAQSPGFAPLLDLVRGANPRAQAAFLYAPGLVLVLAALELAAAQAGVEGALRGQALGWALLAVGPVGGALLTLALPRLARSAWFQASSVLNDIDARWAVLDRDDADDRLMVYLEWTLRWFPAGLRRLARHDLRHGWRQRRLWLSGAWVVGLAAAALSWSEAPGAALGASVLCGLGMAAVISVVFALQADEPDFLRWWLPVPPARRAAARALVLVLWAQPALWPPALVIGYLSGWAHGAWILGGGLASLGGLVVLGLVTPPLGRLAPWIYAPAAAALVLTSSLLMWWP